MHYIIKSPNFDEYLQLLEKPVSIGYSTDDDTTPWDTQTHEWVKQIDAATTFDTPEKATERFTSPLCDVIAVENGVIIGRMVQSGWTLVKVVGGNL